MRLVTYNVEWFANLFDQQENPLIKTVNKQPYVVCSRRRYAHIAEEGISQSLVHHGIIKPHGMELQAFHTKKSLPGFVFVKLDLHG